MKPGNEREQMEMKAEKAKVLHTDVVIVGGGPAGLAAAVQLYDEGITDLLILEGNMPWAAYSNSVSMMDLASHGLENR